MADEKQSQDSGSNEGEAPTPEVEAELVEAEIVDDGHEDGATAEHSSSADPVSSSDETTTAGKPDRARNWLTPGVVLFLAFALVAALIFGVWRLQSGGVDASRVSSDAISSAPEAEHAMEARDAAPQQDAASSQSDANFAVASAAGQQTEQANALRQDPSDDGAFLPPLPEEADVAPTSTVPLAAAAEDAPEMAVEAEYEEIGAIEAKPLETVEAGAAVVAPNAEDATAAGDAQSDPVTAQSTDSVEAAAELFAADPSGLNSDGIGESAPVASNEIETEAPTAEDPARIDNDIEAIKEAFRAETASLKEALETERRRAAGQQKEIASLRKEFQDVLNEREVAANAEITALKTQLAKIQSGDGLPPSRNVAAAIALAALERKADQGEPFLEEFEVLSQMAPNDANLAGLAPVASTGAPPLGQLKASFPKAAMAALAAAGQGRAKNAGGALWARLQGLVSVRPANPQEGETPRAIISRAEASLENDDLNGALTELSALTSPVRDEMADWLEMASARANIAASIDALNERLLNQLQR